MNLTDFTDAVEDRASQERPFVSTVCLRRALMSVMSRQETVESLDKTDVERVIQRMDYVQQVNNLSWFNEDLSDEQQKEKIVSDTLCRSDILISLEVDGNLRREIKQSFEGDVRLEIVDNPINWIKQGIRHEPSEDREDETPKEIRYLDKNDKEIRSMECWEGTNLYKFRNIINDFSQKLPFTEEAIILYLDEDINPVMTRWEIGKTENSSSKTPEVRFNTNMMKTHDFQMLKTKLEEYLGGLPPYIDPKDYVLFQVVWHEFDGPPQVEKLKTWKKITRQST